QYSPAASTHATSMCQGETSGWSRETLRADDQCTPSADVRSSTVVVVAVQPAAPEFTDHMSQEPSARRTTAGETNMWFGARATATPGPHATPSRDVASRMTLSASTAR